MPETVCCVCQREKEEESSLFCRRCCGNISGDRQYGLGSYYDLEAQSDYNEVTKEDGMLLLSPSLLELVPSTSIVEKPSGLAAVKTPKVKKGSRLSYAEDDDEFYECNGVLSTLALAELVPSTSIVEKPSGLAAVKTPKVKKGPGLFKGKDDVFPKERGQRRTDTNVAGREERSDSQCCCCFFFLLIVGFILWVVLPSSHDGHGGGGGGGVRGGGGCFPGDSIVEIKGVFGHENSQSILLRDVQVGDKIRTGSGFSSVYAFGAKIVGEDVPMLQFDTESGVVLKITHNHMIPIIHKANGYSKTVLAQDVMVGDIVKILDQEDENIVIATTRVIATSQVSNQEGAYHPLTNDGQIVVNGIVASVHATDGIAPFIEIFGIELVGIQGFQQLLYSPLRLLCFTSKDFCSELHHDLADGSHTYLNVVEPLLRFLLPKASRKNELFGREEKENFMEPSSHLSLRVCLLFLLVLSFIVESIYVVAHNIWMWVILLMLILTTKMNKQSELHKSFLASVNVLNIFHGKLQMKTE